MQGKWRKVGFLKNLNKAHFPASKKAFDICYIWWIWAKKTGGKCLKMPFIAFLWCKNIQGIEWYDSCDHTMSLCGYMPGKWRKDGFLKNLSKVHFWAASKKLFDIIMLWMVNFCRKKQEESAWKCHSLLFRM